MNIFEVLLLILLIIAVVAFLALLLFRSMMEVSRKEMENRRHETSWMEAMIQQQDNANRLLLKTERTVNQTLLNILLSKDLPTLTAMQNVTIANLQSPVTSPTKSEYIARDDVSEFLRAVNFSANPGLGEALFSPEADPEFNQFVGEMMGENQINFMEEGG